MRRCLTMFFAMFGLLAGTVALSANKPEGSALATGAQSASATAGPSYRIHGNGRIRMTVTNWGYLGNPSETLIDSTSLGSADTLLAPGLESPSHSKIDYLYEAGLWIGGIVGGDTLVSVGATDYPATYELHPPGEGDPLPFSDSLADEEYHADYADTASDLGRVRTDEVDGVHRPLPVSVRQTTRIVADTTYDGGVIIEVVVRNIGSQPIHGLWLGWYVDSDIRHPAHPNSWINDLSGHRTSSVTVDGHAVNVSASWSADNDGDPDTNTWSFDAHSLTGVLGMMYLGGSPSLTAESFHWWNAGFSRAYDWGPSHAPADTNIHGGTGRAIGDVMKYRRMSSQEIDYDQAFAAVDKTAEGWAPPTSSLIARDFADGYDTRFLESHGAVDLAPGDSITAVWALVVARRFHTQPKHFHDTYDYLAPQTYLAGLGFGSLDTALARMKILWDDSFHDATIGPPLGFDMAGWDDSSAQLEWQKRGTKRLRGYGIFRSLDSNSFSPLPLTVLSRDSGSYRNRNLQRLTTYYYMVRSYDSLGRFGAASPVLSVLPDRPMTPVLLSAHGSKGKLSLNWQTPLEPDIASHLIYRRQTGGAWSLVGQTALPPPFVDSTVINSVIYDYGITAVSALGTESYRSLPVVGLSFSFNGPPMVIDHTLSGATSLTDKDSVTSAWTQMVAGLGGVYRDADPVTTASFGLEVYDPHPATIVVSDGRFAPRPETGSQLSDYLYAGGIAVLSGRDLFNDGAITEGLIRFGPGNWVYDNFGITAAYYPRVLLSHPTRPNAEFVGAHSTDLLLPDIQVDPSRTDWGLNPALPSAGPAVPFVGYLEVDTSRARVIYTYVSSDGNSLSHGKAVGVISKVDGVHAAVLAFPISYSYEDHGRDLVARLLAELGWTSSTPGDMTGDGSVDLLDLIFLIDYLYAAGPIINERNGDVNGDCRLNLIDIVLMINYIFRGGAALQPGCVGP
ncbi:MAG: hypothetical protein HZB43_12300 [candidate division Zixibacteria bacterium]|nr:hypothetical protein [candidate division Zixibacteria bacterium]